MLSKPPKPLGFTLATPLTLCLPTTSLPRPSCARRGLTPQCGQQKQRRQPLRLGFPPRWQQQEPNAPTPEPPRSPDYHANVGSVIDYLREFYPDCAHVEPDLDYFSRDIVFADATGNKIVGQDAYRMLWWVVRTQLRVFFAECVVSISSLYYDDSEGVIYVRWRMEGWVRGLGGGVVVDGMSAYGLDWRGFVGFHKVESEVRGRGKKAVLRGWEGGYGETVGVGAGGGRIGAGGCWFGEDDAEDVSKGGQR